MAIVNKKYVTLLFKFVVIFLMLYPSIAICIEEGERIVAIVNGITITYIKIATNREKEQHIFELQNKRKSTPKEIEFLVRQVESSALLKEINSIIKKEAFRKFNIQTTEEEVREELRKVYAGLDMPMSEVLKKQRIYWTELVHALKEVQDDTESEKRIFDNYLSDIMTYETWQCHMNYYNTPEKIVWIEKHIPDTEEDLYKNPGAAIEAWILNKKLKKVITKDVEVTDEEVTRFYESQFCEKKEKPQFEEVKSELQEELLEIKCRDREQEWWQEQYKKARIEIKDERFKDVLEMLIPSAGKELKKEIKP